MLVGLEFAKYVAPIIYVAMKIEQELGLQAAPLVSVFAMRAFRGVLSTGQGLPEIGTAEPERLMLGMRSAMFLKTRAAYVMYALIVAQFALFLLATFSTGYHFM
jgi:hypothetical protein